MGKYPKPELDENALYGLAGEYVEATTSCTEAPRAGVLFDYLAVCGALVGRDAYAQVARTRHAPALFTLKIGSTAHGRKGLTVGIVQDTARELLGDHELAHVFVTGLSTGEGVLKHLETKYTKEGEVIQRSLDKRRVVVEEEFARPLAVNKRDQSTLSAVLRQLWDGSTTGTMTKVDPVKVEGAHVAILGAITPEELGDKLASTDVFNGFMNRFLLIWHEKEGRFSDGGQIPQAVVDDFASRTDAAVFKARTLGLVSRSKAAERYWDRHLYDQLQEGQDVAGALYEAAVGRATAQVLRLSLLYAILDGDKEIHVPHLAAAAAAWRYCQDTALYVFGDSLTGNPDSDAVLVAVRKAGRLTKTDMARLFHGHKSRKELSVIYQVLVKAGHCHWEKEPTSGAPRWWLVFDE